MTSSIPHGVYLALEKIEGLYLKSACSGYRTIFHFKDGLFPLSEYHIIDNGFITKNVMRFLSDGYSHCFEFGSKYLPIKITITDKEYIFENNENQKQILTIGGGKIFLQVLREYYHNSSSYLNINDRRREMLLAQIKHKEEYIKEKNKEIDSIYNQIQKINNECDALNKEMIYNSQND